MKWDNPLREPAVYLVGIPLIIVILRVTGVTSDNPYYYDKGDSEGWQDAQYQKALDYEAEEDAWREHFRQNGEIKD